MPQQCTKASARIRSFVIILSLSLRETTSRGALHSRAHRTMRKAPEGPPQKGAAGYQPRRVAPRADPPGPPPTRSNRSPYATPVACADNDRINHLTPTGHRTTGFRPCDGRGTASGKSHRKTNFISSSFCGVSFTGGLHGGSRRHSDLLSRAWSGMVKRGGISRVAATSLSHYCGKLVPVI